MRSLQTLTSSQAGQADRQADCDCRRAERTNKLRSGDSNVN